MSRAGAARRRLVTALAGVAALSAASLSIVVLPGASAAEQPPTIDCPQVKQAPILPDDYNPNGKNIDLRPDRRGVYVPVIMVPDWSGRATHDDTRTGDFSTKIDLGVSGPLPPPDLAAFAPPTPTPTTAAERKQAAAQAQAEAKAAKAAAKALAKASPGATPAPLPTVAPVDGRASLIGHLQRVPGAVVYTFDYRDNAGRWVDDPGIGPALGDAIDCVSAAMGQKVILVTKGVGGLAARFATAGLTDDRTRGDKVSTVIDYGSPQTGSLMAELLNTGIGKTASEPRILLRLLLASCAAVPVKNLPLDAPCSYLPTLAGLMSGVDGLALRTGSSQLLALRPFPPNVVVHAYAGESSFASSQLGWFGLRPFRSSAVSLGDLTAQTASTTVGAQTQLRAPCAMQLDAFGAPTQSAGLRIAEVGLIASAVPAVTPPWFSTARPCYNGSLTRIQEFAVNLMTIIKAEIRDRQPIDLEELESLPVPGLCGHPAGNLVGGYLPNIADGQGYVGLGSSIDPGRFSQNSVFADVTGEGVPDTIVVLKCATAEGQGSDTVAAYDNESRLLGHVVLQSITNQVVNRVYEVIVTGGIVKMRWATTRDTDDPCCPSVDVAATFTYDPVTDVLVPGAKVNSFNETERARELLTAVKRGQRQKAMRWASQEIVDIMLDADRNYGGLGAASCYGSNFRDDSWPPEAIEEYGDWPQPDGGTHGDRFCLIELNGEPVALLGMAHRGFRDWIAVEFLIPTDSPVVDTGDDGLLPPVFGEEEPEPTAEPEDDEGGPLFP